MLVHIIISEHEGCLLCSGQMLFVHHIVPAQIILAVGAGCQCCMKLPTHTGTMEYFEGMLFHCVWLFVTTKRKSLLQKRLEAGRWKTADTNQESLGNSLIHLWYCLSSSWTSVEKNEKHIPLSQHLPPNVVIWSVHYWPRQQEQWLVMWSSSSGYVAVRESGPID